MTFNVEFRRKGDVDWIKAPEFHFYESARVVQQPRQADAITPEAYDAAIGVICSWDRDFESPQECLDRLLAVLSPLAECSEDSK